MPSSRKVAALGVLAAALLLAWVQWRLAFTRNVVESRVVGNGQARVLHTETTTNGLLLGGAVAVLSAGVGTFVSLVALPSAGSVALARRRAWSRGGIATLIIASIATTAAVAAGESSTALAERPSRLAVPAFRTTSQFTAVMGATDMGCVRTRPALAHGSAMAIVCSIPSRADIRDGHDDVLVAVWRSADARDRWLAQHVEDRARAVVGRVWAAMCEFQSTCAGIAHRLRIVSE